MSIDLKGKVCIVTGGGRGLGRAMTLALVEAGADVVAAGHIAEDSPMIQAAVKAVGKGRVHAMVADVRKYADCEAVVAAALKTFGGLHMLVNNAGLGMTLVNRNFTSELPPFWTVEPETWQLIMDTNANGPFYMARAAIGHMRQQNWGRIVNVAADIETMQRRGYMPYGCSKGALEGFTVASSLDLGGTGVTVNILVPGGPTDTDILPGKKGATDRDGTGRVILSPDVMRKPIVWLASDESNGITGRRYVGKDWDAALPNDEAARRASRPAGFVRREDM